MNLLRKILFPFLILALFSCSPKKNLGKSGENKADKSTKSSANNEENSIPSFSKLIMTPPPPQIGGDKIISFSVTDQVPLKDVLIELGRVAKIDIDLDSGITGGIDINAKNRPLKEVIDRIASLGKLRYSYQNGILHFERDLPYSKNYFVDFLSGSQLWTDVESNIAAILSDSSAVSTKGSSGSSSNNSANSRFTSNKSAGIISVYASRAQHQQISSYLDDVYKNSSAQVLIEAKVVEVTLSKEFDTGIDWNSKSFTTNASTTNAGFGNTAAKSVANFSGQVSGVKLLGIKDLVGSIKTLELFGRTKAISSPRINAINNQKASLDFSQKKIYFTISASAAQSVSAATGSAGNNGVISSTITATKNEIDIGVKLDIIPSINLATNEITLDVKPKLSIDTGTVAIDPSVNPTTGVSLGNTVPIINTREISTIAKIQSGNILVIGGLLTENGNDNSSGLPFLMEIPFFKYLFGVFSRYSTKVETVIFIRATIINSSDEIKKPDREFYDRYSPDNPKKDWRLENALS
ncbi:MAG: hypothetical protein SFV53_00590 [Rickettsiales bacterium]|nr:hypothetical protein [Rickettsiales bacterium]